MRKISNFTWATICVSSLSLSYYVDIELFMSDRFSSYNTLVKIDRSRPSSDEQQQQTNWNTQFVDNIQQRLECCGWNNITIYNGDIPLSCCEDYKSQFSTILLQLQNGVDLAQEKCFNPYQTECKVTNLSNSPFNLPWAMCMVRKRNRNCALETALVSNYDFVPCLREL